MADITKFIYFVGGILDAAGYLVSALGPAVPGWALPTMVFVLSAAIAFATGTSFGTMAVLIPLAIPLASGP